MRFEYQEHLYALMLLPLLLLAFLYVWQYRKKAIARIGHAPVVKRLMGNFSKHKYRLKFILILTIVALLVIAWANPQSGRTVSTPSTTQQSVEVMIAMDASYSMLAQDLAPNRMERAKRFAEELVEGLKGERIGLVFFAGNAYLKMALTNDYRAAKLYISTANPYQIPTPGTAISEAIERSMNTFDEESEADKVLILITDGENHEEAALETAKEAADRGIITFTIGVGTEQGGFIPTNVNGYQDYKRDETGQPVRTRLEESVLKEIAEASRGSYYPIQVGSSAIVNALKQQVETMNREEYERNVFDEYASYYQYFVGMALILLILEFFLSYKKNRWMENRDLFG